MDRLAGHISAVLGRVIFIGFSVQIALGLLWMRSAFAFLELKEGFVCAGQLLAACGAGWFFLRCAGVEKGWRRIWGSMAMVTFPMNMQCHMAVGTWSVLSSLLLSELACVVLALRKEDKKTLWQAVLGLWLAAGLIQWKYLWIGAAPALFLWARQAFCPGRKKKAWIWLALIAAVGGMIAGVGSLYQERTKPEACLASRMAWTTLDKAYDIWPQEWRDKIDYWTVSMASYEAGGIKKVLLPYLEETVGEEEAGHFLVKISQIAWERDPFRIMKEIAWDALGYLAPPTVLPLQLQGRAYDSYSGINYRQILMAAPRLGKGYMDYGCWWFMAGIGLCILLMAFRPRKISWRCLWLVCLTAAVSIGCDVMSGAGQMDYRNSVCIMCLWIAGMIQIAGRSAEPSGGDLDEKDK